MSPCPATGWSTARAATTSSTPATACSWERTNVEALERVYRDVTGETRDFGTLVRRCKQIIMQTSMASEINTLSHQLDRITERNRKYRDFTLSNLRYALREFIASLAIYRSYTTPDGQVSDRDRHFIELACEQAKLSNQRTSEDIFDFIRDTVLLRNLDQFPQKDRPRILDWVLRFQQVTGPIMAKGIEDTAFYVYNKLISLNEVGGHPDRCEATLEAFHRLNAERAEHWPSAMLCSSTHDTKRSEDVRARINVLAELVEEWDRNVTCWLGLTTEPRLAGRGDAGPDGQRPVPALSNPAGNLAGPGPEHVRRNSPPIAIGSCATWRKRSRRPSSTRAG